MIEECVPVSFIQKQIEIKKNDLEYELCKDEDRRASYKLSCQIDALEDLIKQWINKGY